MKRKSNFKRRFARVYLHLERVADEIYLMMKMCEDDPGVCNIMEEVALAALYLQQHVKKIWETWWGEWPQRIESYR